jgi:hypothetical protein
MILWVMNDRYCHALRLTLIVIDDMDYAVMRTLWEHFVPFVSAGDGDSDRKKYPASMRIGA